MPLNRNALEQTLKQVFRDAKKHGWTADKVAEELADAIDAFVKTGQITGLQVSVAIGAVTHTGNQSNTVHVQ
jgi:hypothetical protein